MSLTADVSVSSVAAFVELFAPGNTLKPGRTSWYRGEGLLRRRRALLPSIARPPSNPEEEWEIYQRFRQNAAAYLPHAILTEWDWMLYMRHYGARTRLLDWTESPLVALYFAVEKQSRDRQEGVVWCLDPERLNELAGFEPRVYCAGIDNELNVYTPSEVKASPPTTKHKPAALIAARSFARLIAQQGVFTVIHRDANALDTIADTKLLSRVRIPPGAKASIRVALDELGINRLSMFPELQSVTGGSK